MHTRLLDKQILDRDEDFYKFQDTEVFEHQQSSLSTWVATMVYLHSSLKMTDAEIHPNLSATTLIPV